MPSTPSPNKYLCIDRAYFRPLLVFRTEDAGFSGGRLSEALGDWGSGNLERGGFGERVGTGEVSLQAT